MTEIEESERDLDFLYKKTQFPEVFMQNKLVPSTTFRAGSEQRRMEPILWRPLEFIRVHPMRYVKPLSHRVNSWLI